MKRPVIDDLLLIGSLFYRWNSLLWEKNERL